MSFDCGQHQQPGPQQDFDLGQFANDGCGLGDGEIDYLADFDFDQVTIVQPLQNDHNNASHCPNMAQGLDVTPLLMQPLSTPPQTESDVAAQSNQSYSNMVNDQFLLGQWSTTSLNASPPPQQQIPHQSSFTNGMNQYDVSPQIMHNTSQTRAVGQYSMPPAQMMNQQSHQKHLRQQQAGQAHQMASGSSPISPESLVSMSASNSTNMPSPNIYNQASPYTTVQMQQNQHFQQFQQQHNISPALMSQMKRHPAHLSSNTPQIALANTPTMHASMNAPGVTYNGQQTPATHMPQNRMLQGHGIAAAPTPPPARKPTTTRKKSSPKGKYASQAGGVASTPSARTNTKQTTNTKSTAKGRAKTPAAKRVPKQPAPQSVNKSGAPAPVIDLTQFGVEGHSPKNARKRAAPDTPSENPAVIKKQATAAHNIHVIQGSTFDIPQFRTQAEANTWWNKLPQHRQAEARAIFHARRQQAIQQHNLRQQQLQQQQLTMEQADTEAQLKAKEERLAEAELERQKLRELDKRIAEENKKYEEACRNAEERKAAEWEQLTPEQRAAKERFEEAKKRRDEDRQKAKEQEIAEKKELWQEMRLAAEKAHEQARSAKNAELAKRKQLAQENQLAKEKAEEQARIAKEPELAKQKRLADAQRLTREKQARDLLQQQEATARALQESKLRTFEQQRLANEQAERIRIAQAQKDDVQRRLERKQFLRKDPSALFRHYNEYLEYFPLGPGEERSQYHSTLLANRTKLMDPTADLNLAIQYAYDHWEYYYQWPRDVNDCAKWQREKLAREQEESNKLSGAHGGQAAGGQK